MSDYDQKYLDLLLQNSMFNKKIRYGQMGPRPPELRAIKKELLSIELKMTASDIIRHAEYLFPAVENT